MRLKIWSISGAAAPNAVGTLWLRLEPKAPAAHAAKGLEFEIALGNGAMRAVVRDQLNFREAIDVPALLIGPASPGLDDDARMLSLDAALQPLTNESLLEGRRAILDFCEAMRRVAVGGTASGDALFFGCRTAGGVAWQAVAAIDLMPLLQLDPHPQKLFELTLTARVSVQWTTGAAAAAAALGDLCFVVALDADFALRLRPRLLLPSLPPLDLQAAAVASLLAAGEVRLDRFTFNVATSTQRLEMPVPGGGVELDLTPPQMTLSLDAAGALSITCTAPGNGTLRLGTTRVLSFDGLTLALSSADGLKLAVSVQAPIGASTSLDEISFDDPALGPYRLRLSGIVVALQVDNPATGALHVDVTIGRAEVTARSDPTLALALQIVLRTSLVSGRLKTAVESLRLLDPDPLQLAGALVDWIEESGRRLWAMRIVIGLPTVSAPALPGLPSLAGAQALLQRLADLLAEGARWAARQATAAGSALEGLASAAVDLMGSALHALSKLFQAPAIPGGWQVPALRVELRFDLAARRLAQVVIVPAADVATPGQLRVATGFLGLEVRLPAAWTPALIVDLERQWTALAVCVPPEAAPSPLALSLSSDLWMGDSDSPTEPVTAQSAGAAADKVHLLQLDLGAATPANPAIALVYWSATGARFLAPLDLVPAPTGATLGNDGLLLGGALYGAAAGFPQLNGSLKINAGQLSLFRSPPAPGAPSDALSSVIEVGALAPVVLAPPYDDLKTTIPVKLKLGGMGPPGGIDVKLVLALNLRTLQARLDADAISIGLGNGNPFDLLGMQATFVAPDGSALAADVKPLRLSLNAGNPSLQLDRTKAKLQLRYTRLSAGQALMFEVDRFAYTRDGIDLDARVCNDPVTLAGLDMPFRFEQGALSIRGGRLQAVSLVGHGHLPPALVGEAAATIRLDFAVRDGALALQSCAADLDLTKAPLHCHATRFDLRIDHLGLKFVDEHGYHFYFTLTGSAQFNPGEGEFTEGLLKNLSKLRVVLHEVPLASDVSVLMRHIEFIVPVDPPDHTKLFDLFDFECRGITFHPASPAFGGAPAVGITGQIHFCDTGDVPSANFKFHILWIAPPDAESKGLPRLRCDGLGLALNFGPNVSVSGTAVAVDGLLPVTEGVQLAAAGVTAKGFLATGSLTIKGWASMSASMGFLELSKAGVTEKRHAFFLFIQQNDIAIRIDTPVGEYFIRELGFGCGYRYTLLGLAAADQAETPPELVQLLDSISRYQGDLSDFRGWSATFDNASITLAMRALFSMSSASEEYSYDEEGEKELSNMLLFDVVAALRTDLTFLMNLRAWVAYNYADWRSARRAGGADWQTNPTLRGYMYVSAPKREFLARALAAPGSAIGDHPKLYPELKSAMQKVKWSSTLYVTPGLFHQEMGWPYELGFEMKEDHFFLKVEGGTVLRVESGAVLYGLAFRAVGQVQFAADSGGSFGASVSAVADFAVAAKLIAYIALQRNDTLLYGTLSLDLTLAFSVQMWLRTRWFSASAGFCVSLTIHIGVELLAEPGGIAAVIEASVSVSAFGRSLTLGIGFSVGKTGLLADARNRTTRFLSLGLGCAHPDPAAGVPRAAAPLPEPPRQQTVAAADAALGQASQHRADACPEGPPPAAAAGATAPSPGIEIGAPGFVALLIPVAADAAIDQDFYLMQLLPAAEPDEHQGAPYYAAPLDSEGVGELLDRAAWPEVYQLSCGAAPAGASPWMHLTDGGKTTTSISLDAQAAPTGLRMNPDALVGHPTRADKSAPPPRLADYLRHGCFLYVDAGQQLTNVPALRDAAPRALPDDPQMRADVLRRAARSRADLGDRYKRFLNVHESRSVFVATVGQCAAELASQLRVTRVAGGLQVSGGAASMLEFDPTALGLTFIVNADSLAAMADGTLKVGISTRLPAAPAAPTFGAAEPLRCFNPPDTMFDASPPRLAGQSHSLRPDGVFLHWTAVAGAAAGRGGGPVEEQIKHYRVERRLVAGAGALRLPARRYTVKQGSALEFSVDQCGLLTTTPHRSTLQLVDDLLDLPADLRRQIVTSGTAPPGGPGAAGGPIELLYQILPVDCAGRFDLPVPWRIGIDRQWPRQAGLDRAIGRFHYAGMPPLGWTLPLDQTNFFALSLGGPGCGAPGSDWPDLVLRVRREGTVASGLYGADAVTQSRTAPPVPGNDDLPGVNERQFVLSAPPGAPGMGDLWVEVERLPLADAPEAALPDRRPYRLAAPDARAFCDFIGVPLETGVPLPPVAVRLYLRPSPRAGWLAPDWWPVQIQLRIDRDLDAPPGAPALPASAAVDVTVETFEHPRDVVYQALRGAARAESGRLYLLQPAKDACLAPTGMSLAAPACTLALDDQRRIAVRVRWAAQPADLRAQGVPLEAATGAPTAVPALRSLVGGFDVHAIDAAAVPPVSGPRSALDAQGRNRCLSQALDAAAAVARVQRLPSSERGQSPSEIGELAHLEAHYPSESWRREFRGEQPLATWYSAAESALLWPEPTPRRSLCTTIDEADLACLFVEGLPDLIDVCWTGAPDGMRICPQGIEPADADARVTHDLSQVKDRGPTVVDTVRRLLLSMYLTPDADDPQPLPATINVIGSRPSPLKKAPRITTGSVTLRTTPRARLHAVLADTVDLLRYEWSDDSSPVYRRYEVVLEAAPRFQADTLAAFLEESGPQRDPTGWAVLRAWGLAAGLRLYDTREARFLRHHEAREQVRRVFVDKVLPRYTDVAGSIGAPFFSGIGTPEGLAVLASFSGGAPLASAAGDDDAFLGMVQIELRPVAQALRQPDNLPVRYARLVRAPGAPPGSRSVTLTKPPGSGSLIIEVLPATGPTATSKRRIVLVEPPTPPADGVVPAASPEPTLPDADQISQITLDLSAARSGEPLAWVRLICQDPHFQVESLVLCDKSVATLEVESIIPCTSARDQPRAWGRFDALPAAWLDALYFPKEKPLDSKEALSPLQTLWRAWLQGRPAGAGSASAAAQATDDQASFDKEFPPRPGTGDAISPAQAAARRQELLARLGAWSQRFLDLGSAHAWQTDPGAAHPPVAGAMALPPVGFAIGLLTRPSPWRVAPDDAAQLSVLMFEKDRYGKTRKYAVRPYGRYESLVQAVLAESGEAPSTVPESADPSLRALRRGAAAERQARSRLRASPTLRDIDAAFGTGATEKCLRSHFADAVIDRSEPLAPPTIIAMRTRPPALPGPTASAAPVEATPMAASPPATLVELVIARHPEELIAESNSVLDAAVQMRHVAVSFWREFSAPQWLESVSVVEGGSTPLDAGAGFGPHPTEAAMPPLLAEPLALELEGEAVSLQSLRTLYPTFPDLWRGAQVLGLAALPYGFRFHAAVHAAAGVVVSAQSLATAESLPPVLRFPWRSVDGLAVAQSPGGSNGSDGGGPVGLPVKTPLAAPVAPPPWRPLADTPPSYDLLAEADLAQAASLRLRIDWPLLRYLDGVTDAAAAVWFRGSEAPPFFLAPDATIGYRLSVASASGASRTPELEIAASNTPAASADELYRQTIVGSRFGAIDTLPPRVGMIPSGFTLSVTVKVSGDAAPPPAPVFQPQLLPLALALLDLDPARTEWPAWSAIAPLARSAGAGQYRRLTVTPPPEQKPLVGTPSPIWAAFRNALVQFESRLIGYAAIPNAPRIVDVAQAQLAAIQPLIVDRASWPAENDSGIAMPMTIAVPWLWGASPTLPASIVAEPVAGWIWPDVSATATGAPARQSIATALTEPDRGEVLAAMRRYRIELRTHLDDMPLAGFAPRTRQFDVSAVPDADAWPASPLHRLLLQVDLPTDPDRTEAAIETAFAALENLTDAGPTLNALEQMRNAPPAAASVLLRPACRAEVQAALTPLNPGGAVPAVKPIAWTLRAPLPSAATAALPGGVQAAARTASDEMLFGPGQELWIAALQGAQPPLNGRVTHR